MDVTPPATGQGDAPASPPWPSPHPSGSAASPAWPPPR